MLDKTNDLVNAVIDQIPLGNILGAKTQAPDRFKIDYSFRGFRESDEQVKKERTAVCTSQGLINKAQSELRTYHAHQLNKFFPSLLLNGCP
jgi:hypothetical protein